MWEWHPQDAGTITINSTRGQGLPPGRALRLGHCPTAHDRGSPPALASAATTRSIPGAGIRLTQAVFYANSRLGVALVIRRVATDSDNTAANLRFAPESITPNLSSGAGRENERGAPCVPKRTPVTPPTPNKL